MLVTLAFVVSVGFCTAEAPFFRKSAFLNKKVIAFERQELPVEDYQVHEPEPPYPAAGITPEIPFELPATAREYSTPIFRNEQIPVREYGPPTIAEDEFIEEEEDVPQPERIVVYRSPRWRV